MKNYLQCWKITCILQRNTLQVILLRTLQVTKNTTKRGLSCNSRYKPNEFYVFSFRFSQEFITQKIFRSFFLQLPFFVPQHTVQYQCFILYSQCSVFLEVVFIFIFLFKISFLTSFIDLGLEFRESLSFIESRISYLWGVSLGV